MCCPGICLRLRPSFAAYCGRGLVPPGQLVWQLLAGAGGMCPTPEGMGRAGMHQAVEQVLSGVQRAGEGGIKTE